MISTRFRSGTNGAVLLYALLIAVHTFFALPVYANTVWNPIANGIVPPDVGNWGDAANWASGLPGFGPNHDPDDGLDPKAVFNVAGAAECQVTDTRGCWDLVMGENGLGGVLRVVDGGTLTTEGGWMSVGWNNTAKLIVEEGGVCNFDGHLWWGMHAGGNATIEINGGTITGGADFGLGFWYGTLGDNGIAHVYVNSGTLNIHHWNATEAIHDGSVLDIGLGSVTILGDQTEAVSGYVAAGKITAYGGAGRVLYDHNITNPGKTTIRAIDVIENPTFELFQYHPDPNFPKPLYWEIENYVADVNCLFPTIEPQDEGYGNADEWLNNLNITGLCPKDGGRLLMLSTGNISSRPTYHSKAWQPISVQEGDRISGYYFFGTCDYLASIEYDDYATISLVDNVDPNSHILLAKKSVEDVGDHSSMAGWERFEHRFTSDEAGQYDLTFFVTDIEDDLVNSYLGVDNLQLCAAPEYGDINLDCQTDNLDFAILAKFWQINCYEPPGDPNQCDDWASVGSPGDLDGNEIINVDDLRLFASGWLTGE